MDTNRLDLLKCGAQKSEESLSGKSAEWWAGYRQGLADHAAQSYYLIGRPARFDTSIPRRTTTEANTSEYPCDYHAP